MNAFDNRLINLTITIDGQSYTFDQNFYIVAQGTRKAGGLFGDFSVRIDNISKNIRDHIILRTSQWAKNKTVANVVLNVGRQSYGTFQMFLGQAVAAKPSQPPDIGLTLNVLDQAQMFTYAATVSFPQNATIQTICQQVATLAGMQLAFSVSQQNNITVGGHQFTGSVARQIKNLNYLGNINAYADGNTLVVTDANTPRPVPTVIVDAQHGMIGVPEITALGVRVIQLINNEVTIGAPVQVTSKVNPAANGLYRIYQLGFQVASREQPFYWIMDLRPADLANVGTP